MLIRFLGTGDTSRSFIELLQRYVEVGEVIRVKNSIAERLLVTGRWHKVTEAEDISSNSSPAKSTPKRGAGGKGMPRRSSRPSGTKSEPSDIGDPERQQSKSEVCR